MTSGSDSVVDVPFKIVSSIICEDIRQEITRKFILIGVFGGDINVAQIPALLQLAIFMEVQSTEIGIFDLEFRVINDSDVQIVGGNVRFQVTDESLFGTSLGPFPVPTPSPGALRFQWRLPGSDWETIRAIRVNFNPSAVNEVVRQGSGV